MTDPVPSPPTPGPDLRRLRRSRRDRMIGGVCGGIARYLDVDPVLLRVVAVALALSGGFGVLAYVIAWIVIPEADPDEPERPPTAAGRHSIVITVGAALVALGVLLLTREWLPWFTELVFWPLVVAIGVLMLISARRTRP